MYKGFFSGLGDRRLNRLRLYGFRFRTSILLWPTVWVGAGLFWNYVIVRFIWGPDHPGNRFTYRKWKREGRLDPELLKKEFLIRRYWRERMTELNVGDENKPSADERMDQAFDWLYERIGAGWDAVTSGIVATVAGTASRNNNNSQEKDRTNPALKKAH